MQKVINPEKFIEWLNEQIEEAHKYEELSADVKDYTHAHEYEEDAKTYDFIKQCIMYPEQHGIEFFENIESEV